MDPPAGPALFQHTRTGRVAHLCVGRAPAFAPATDHPTEVLSPAHDVSCLAERALGIAMPPEMFARAQRLMAFAAPELMRNPLVTMVVPVAWSDGPLMMTRGWPDPPPPVPDDIQLRLLVGLLTDKWVPHDADFPDVPDVFMKTPVVRCVAWVDPIPHTLLGRRKPIPAVPRATIPLHTPCFSQTPEPRRSIGSAYPVGCEDSGRFGTGGMLCRHPHYQHVLALTACRPFLRYGEADGRAAEGRTVQVPGSEYAELRQLDAFLHTRGYEERDAILRKIFREKQDRQDAFRAHGWDGALEATDDDTQPVGRIVRASLQQPDGDGAVFEYALVELSELPVPEGAAMVDIPVRPLSHHDIFPCGDGATSGEMSAWMKMQIGCGAFQRVVHGALLSKDLPLKYTGLATVRFWGGERQATGDMGACVVDPGTGEPLGMWLGSVSPGIDFLVPIHAVQRALGIVPVRFEPK